MAASLRKKIMSNFKLQGLQLTNDATLTLMQYLRPYSENEHLTQIIDQIIEAVQKQDLKTQLISKDLLEMAVEECNAETDSDADKALVVINAFDTPCFTYNTDQRKFISVPPSSLKLHAEASAKPKLFRERFNLIHQRTIRHELFSPPVVGQTAAQASPKFQLRTIEYLLSSSGLPDKVIVLGVLVQLKEGKFHLEDMTGVVEVDLTQCVFQTGLFVETSIVLAEGVYYDEIFHVGGIGFPPIESADESRKYFGSVNFFGGPSTVCAKSSVKHQAMLEQHKNAALVFVSDIFLDDKKVMNRLGQLFAGYSDCPPVAFFFMGNFNSKPYGHDKNQRFEASFKELGDLMMGYPNLIEKSNFYFIPGPLDPGPGKVLPRPPIPSTLVQGITDRIPTAQFCSNPCRVQFCTREIVLFRDDILNRVCRHCVRFPTEGIDIRQHFTRSLLSQSHLSPLPIHSRPVYWMYDHALRLYPLPDLVLIGDQCDPYSVVMDNCCVANPGSFSRNGFEFKVYLPYTGQLDDSKLPD